MKNVKDDTGKKSKISLRAKKTKIKNINYISAKESRRIAKENRKITKELDKNFNRKNVPEVEYSSAMRNPENVVEFDNLHYFFTDIVLLKP